MANNSAVPNRLDNVLNYLKSSKLLPKRVTHIVNIESLEPNVTYEISVYVCYPISNRIYNYFFIHIWTWIDSLIYSFIPIATMTVCSAMIIMEVRKKSLQVARRCRQPVRPAKRASRTAGEKNYPRERGLPPPKRGGVSSGERPQVPLEPGRSEPARRASYRR